MVRSGFASKTFRLAQRKNGHCVFLNEAGLCRIHLEFGADAKPTICRIFPLQLIPRDGKLALTLRRSCPSAAADKGRSLKEQLPVVQQHVRDSRMQAIAIAPPALKRGEQRDWKVIGRALEVLAELLLDPRFPPVRRLVHAVQFANLLDKAKTKSMDDLKLVELIDTLCEIVPEESKRFFSDRQPVGAYAKILFRSIGLEFARLHPQHVAQRNWLQRLQMVASLFRLVRGNGSAPITKPFPRAQFNDLEKPLGALSNDIDHALSRFIESSAASYIYAIADRRSWSVVDSIRGLAITFPIGLWLLRWASLGREPSTEDMIQIVVALDRGNGFAPLTGSLHRMRLRLLATDGQMERLIVWFAQ